MNFWQRLQRHPRFIRLTNWEYWSMSQIYAPIVPYYLFLSLKARTFFWWSAVNPAIEYAGMLGESKTKIMDMLPERWKPVTVFLPRRSMPSAIEKALENAGLRFPIFLKPDIGGRGFWAAKVENMAELHAFLKDKIQVDFMAQEFVDLPEEFSVLHYRFPNQARGHVNSLTMKGFLKVVGNGRSSVRELMMQQPRAILQLERLGRQQAELLQKVPKQGAVVRLGVVGNHCLGTEFINGNDFIDEQLEKTFDAIAEAMGEIYYARYDLKCTSFEDLKAGRNIKIMEVNGAGAEPAHIYDKNLGLGPRYRAIFWHYRLLCDIGRMNHQRGVPYMSFKKFRAWWRFLKAYDVLTGQ